MSILNKTRKTLLAHNHVMCRSMHSKAIGLMFSIESKVEKNSLIFEFNKPSYQSMHMFFVFYNIDVIFLDEHRHIVDMKEEFKPFTLYNSRIKSKYVIELPKNTIKNSGTRIGDNLEWH